MLSQGDKSHNFRRRIAKDDPRAAAALIADDATFQEVGLHQCPSEEKGKGHAEP
jgi:hypothetical protein